MKKKYSGLFLIMIFLGSTGVLQAQNLKEFIKDRKKKVKEKIIEKTIDEAGKSADEKIEKGVDRLFERTDSLSVKESKEENENPKKEEESIEDSVNEKSPFKLFDGEGVLPARAEYTFDYELEMQSLIEEEGESPDTFNVLLYLNKEGGPAYMGSRAGSTEDDIFVIIDFEKNNMVTLNQGSAMIMKWDPEKLKSKEVEEGEDKNFHIEKTGRTKTIAGYSCEEYRVADDEGEGVVWISSELPISMNLFNTGQKYTGTLPFSDEEIQGFPMESDYRSYSDGSHSHMEVKKVENKRQRFDMSDYRQMKLPKFMNKKKDQ